MDVAIVGGGVAGCYCAYRLAREHPDWDIRLFEASDRIGGRLWSVPVAGLKGPPAEMGGMFISDIQPNLYGLVTKELKLRIDALDWSQRHQYLRGVYLDNDTYSKPDDVPFRFNDDEKYKDPIYLLLYAMQKIVPGFYDLWPWKEELSPRGTYNRLRATHHAGRPLYEWGFWNVLSDVISNEAYSVLFSTIGIGSYFRNANAMESIWVLLRSMAPQTYYRIEGGYQQLPLKLLEGVKDTVRARTDRKLTNVGREKGDFVLTFATSDDEEVVKRADKLILALPRRALQSIAFDDSLFADAKQFRRDLDTVISVPVCKLYLTFADTWWDRSKFGPSQLGRNAVAAAFTDLPMRQCYYFGRRDYREPALLLAGFTDEIGVSFWSGLSNKGDDFPNPAQSAADRAALKTTKTMVASALKQLKEMHDDHPVPAPRGAFFMDWGAEPHSAGWHDWAPGAKSWKMAGRIRQPNPKLEFFICGEAYSQQQGWSEGAINSAEMVLRRLGLKQPDWVEIPNYEFEVEGESKNGDPVGRIDYRAIP